MIFLQYTSWIIFLKIESMIPYFSYFSILASAYQQLVEESNIVSCALEFLGSNSWPASNYTSWNNPENSFADKSYPSSIFDHIFLRTKSPEKVQARTYEFEVSKLKTACKPTSGEEKIKTKSQSNDQCPSFEVTLEKLNLTQCYPSSETGRSLLAMHSNAARRRQRTICESQNRISLSDHEAVTATIRIRKLGSNADKSKLMQFLSNITHKRKISLIHQYSQLQDGTSANQRKIV